MKSFWRQKKSLNYKLNQFAINYLIPSYRTMLACLVTAFIIAMAYTTYFRAVLPEIHKTNWNNGYKQAILDINNLRDK